MRILLVSATQMEVATAVALMLPEASGNKTGTYTCGAHQIDSLITGIGMTKTAYWMGKRLSSSRYDLCINAGIAGSFRADLPPGAVVQVIEDRFADLGAEDGNDFLPLDDLYIGETTTIQLPAFSHPFLNQLRRVKGITVNKVHGNEVTIQSTRSRFDPDVESMEGAAFLYACAMDKTPAVQLRAISNYVERRNRNAWNIELAVQKLNETLLQFILTC